MNKLFYVSSVSPLMYDTIISEKLNNPGKTTVLTPRAGVFQYLSSNGIDVKLLSQESKMSVRRRDKLLFDRMMPGEFGDECFPGTTLPLWEVLAIDRLKFWYVPANDRLIEFIKSLVWDVAYVSLDIGDALPFAIGLLAKDTNRECVAIKTEPIRTVEMYDLKDVLPFSEYHVWNNLDVLFLNKLNLDAKIINCDYPYPISPTKFVDKERALGSFGESDKEFVGGVLFDKRDERACRKFLHMINDTYGVDRGVVLLYPVDNRSRELMPKILWEFKELCTTVYDKGMLSACGEIVSFRWDDNYCLDLPMAPTIFDVHDIRLSTKVAPDYADIRGFDI